MGEVPSLQVVIEEAVDAGIETVIVVNHPSKTAVERYFDPAPELLANSSRRASTSSPNGCAPRPLDVRFVHQPEPLGLGHAVGMANELIGDEPFAVLLPDEVMGSSDLLSAMLDAYAEHRRVGRRSEAGAARPGQLVRSRRPVRPDGRAGGLLPVSDLVEKPPVDEAPSDYVIIGRYVCTAEVMTEIGRLEPGAGGELQLTDALRSVAGYEPFFGLVGDELPGGLMRHDTGNPAGWLEAVIEVVATRRRSSGLSSGS